MKVCILGDIHGNYRALEAVLLSASKANVDKLLVTGDLVGYYFAPRRVIDLLGDWDCDFVRGNHEVMLANSRFDPVYLAMTELRYGSGIRIAIEQLDTKQLDKLCALPHPLELEIDGIRILLSHGSPWDINHYIYPDADSETFMRCTLGNYDLIVMGHTHYPMLKEVGKIFLVNPGSVGQTRNRQLGAYWALLDTESRKIELRRESYDSSELIRECQLRHPELPYLWEVLQRHE